MICPICPRKTVPAFRPFCSKRCADVDLGRWLTESYRVPAEDTADEGAEEGAEEGEPGPNRP